MFTRQELIYLATGARLLALQAEQNRDNTPSPTMKDIHESARKTYAELAEKCERLRKQTP